MISPEPVEIGPLYIDYLVE
jgi:hypothetical protein